MLGPVPGVMGTLQALECMKLLSGVGEPLSQVLLRCPAPRCPAARHTWSRRPPPRLAQGLPSARCVRSTSQAASSAPYSPAALYRCDGYSVRVPVVACAFRSLAFDPACHVKHAAALIPASPAFSWTTFTGGPAARAHPSRPADPQLLQSAGEAESVQRCRHTRLRCRVKQTRASV